MSQQPTKPAAGGVTKTRAYPCHTFDEESLVTVMQERIDQLDGAAGIYFLNPAYTVSGDTRRAAEFERAVRKAHAAWWRRLGRARDRKQVRRRIRELKRANSKQRILAYMGAIVRNGQVTKANWRNLTPDTACPGNPGPLDR